MNSVNDAPPLLYMPIDFLKTEIIGIDKEYFFNRFSFTPSYNKGVENCKYFTYNNMKLTIYNSGRTILSGSLHVFHNQGLNNSNDFGYDDFLKCIDEIYLYFGIRPINMRILQIELGVNIVTKVSQKVIITNLLFHKRGLFTKSEKNRYSVVKHDHFWFKIYDKSFISNCKDLDILRIEIKYRNWTLFRTIYGLVNFQNFIDFDKTVFLEDLLKRWNEVILINPFTLSKEKQQKFKDLSFWEDKGIKSNPNYSKHFRNLKKINSHCTINLQEEIYLNIKNKVLELQRLTNSKLTENRKQCIYTGYDISMQKSNSHLLSHTGLRFLCENNIHEFERLKNIYLSPTLRSSVLQNQIKEIAHNIRTRYSVKNRTTNKNQVVLFNMG